VRPGPYAALEGTPELAAIREHELATAIAALGVAGHAYLGAPPARALGLPPRRYTDSGMRWVTPTLAGPGDDAGPDSLTAADAGEVAGDIAAFALAVAATDSSRTPTTAGTAILTTSACITRPARRPRSWGCRSTSS